MKISQQSPLVFVLDGDWPTEPIVLVLDGGWPAEPIILVLDGDWPREPIVLVLDGGWPTEPIVLVGWRLTDPIVLVPGDDYWSTNYTKLNTQQLIIYLTLRK